MGMLINDFEDMQLLLEASDGESLLQQLAVAETLPDIVLLDLNMAGMNGIETAKVLQKDYPSIKVIVLSTYFSKAFIINMIELGAAAYLPKNTPPEEVELTIQVVANKGFYYGREVMEVIRDNMVQKTKPKLNAPFGIGLTDREKEILQLICEEYTTGEIAEKLFISPRTVDGHRNNLLQKLGCRNTAGLVVSALQHQLVKLNPERQWKEGN